jgi:GMP synthase (glutamine-hydrolysing)
MRRLAKKKKFSKKDPRFKKEKVASPKQVVLILDFGSQYTQLIARRVRENKVYSKIIPFNTPAKDIAAMNPKGLILSGSPMPITSKKPLYPDKGIFKLGIPLLGISYGMQVIVEMLGGKAKRTRTQSYGKAELFIDENRDLFSHMPGNFTCWASYGSILLKLPIGFCTSAHTTNTPIAAISNSKKKIFGLQFHPEVANTEKGNQIFSNFLFRICGCLGRWTTESFIYETVNKIKKEVGKDRVILGLSGGIDSSVVALLLHKAIGKNSCCIFVNNGLMRKGEPEQVRKVFKDLYRLNLNLVDRSKNFLNRLKGVIDPEEKRKIIGNEFINIFEQEAKKTKGVKFLAQGTLYPDVIESVPTDGTPSKKIKSHHNVGGLPERMKLKLLEPLRELFKDEVREIGRALGLPDTIINRQPFPGPGLAVRIIGEVTKERLDILQEVDKRVVEEIRAANLYDTIWQSFAVLLPIKSVGITADERTYENVVALRCVLSSDGMTAEWANLPYELLDKISNRIINEVKGVNRVVYDITSKPPATIEWE